MGILARISAVRNLRQICRRRRASPRFRFPVLNANLARTPVASSDVVLSNLAVAARCVALRSEILASVPLFLFRRDGNGGRERADDHPLYGVLHDITNATQSAYEFRELMVRCLDLHGNFYARICPTSAPVRQI